MTIETHSLSRPARFAVALLTLLATASSLLAAEPPKAEPGEETIAVLETNHGRMAFRFFPDTPQTNAQIQRLITEGFYDGKLFYRVVAGHVIQAGDGEGEAEPTVPGEFGRPHVKGTVGLARDTDPNSGTSEIYICHEDRPHLDGKYAAFGELVEGLDVLDRIAAVEVDEQFLGGGVAFHKPKKPVVIERASLEKRPAR
ncbi:MAG: peptidylprolyl isomerase [Acidobacteriota bacterium]